MSFPNVSEAFWDWTDTVTFKVLRTTVADFEVVEVPINDVTFEGALEPTKPRDLLIKPENQRNWKWWDMYTTFSLAPGEEIQDPSGSTFRVMSKRNWGNAGYFQYDLLQDPSVLVPAPVQS